jgi:hypothetical protein
MKSLFLGLVCVSLSGCLGSQAKAPGEFQAWRRAEDLEFQAWRIGQYIALQAWLNREP